MTPPKFAEPYIAWWQGLASRERQIVAAGGAVLLLFIFYMLLWAPMQRALTRLRVAVPQDTVKLAQMRAQATQIQQLRARMPAAAQRGNIMSTLEQSAGTRGLRQSISRMEPDGTTGARLTMDEVSFDALIGWIAELQGQGIRLENATIQKRPNPGMVNARIVLRTPT